MAQIDIPIVNGVDESWDDKLLPQGGISRADNVVIEKNGQAKPRGGFVRSAGGSINVPRAVAPAQARYRVRAARLGVAGIRSRANG